MSAFVKAPILSFVPLLLLIPTIMGVVIYPNAVQSQSVRTKALTSAKQALLEIRTDLSKKQDSVRVIQSSFDNDTLSSPIQMSTNGLVYSLIEAYSNHRHLVIRPEDIWFAVLTQFNIYVQANAEKLRHQFVAHEGKEKLIIEYNLPNRDCVDYAAFAKTMTTVMEKHIIDPDLREWILPDFTTTTSKDITVASILMMSSMQKYFDYTMRLTCGIPSVELLGKKEDYQIIFNRLDKLATFGEEPTRFMELLQPVVRRLIASFEAPDSNAVIDFWQRIIDKESGSGYTEYTGWITAFCAWDEKGQFLANRLDGKDNEYSENGSFGKEVQRHGDFEISYHHKLHLMLDLVKYPTVNSDSIPPGWGKVPVELDEWGTIYEAEMVAGSVGRSYSSSGEHDGSGNTGLDTIQPHVGWWIWEDPKPKDSVTKDGSAVTDFRVRDEL